MNNPTTQKGLIYQQCMCNLLVNIDWANTLSSNDINENLVALKNITLEAQSKFVPLQPKKSNTKPPWLKKSIQKENRQLLNNILDLNQITSCITIRTRETKLKLLLGKL